VGGFEAGPPGSVEPTLEYHPYAAEILTRSRYPALGQCQAGSLSGADASQKVTEAPKGSLRLFGNQP
jgi:hypothetical protein